MELNAIAIIISLISLLIAIIALIINWKKFLRERPNLNAFVLNGSYQNQPQDKSIIIDVTVQFINKGHAKGSITDIKGYIRFPESLFKRYPHLKYENNKFMFIERPINFSKNFPVQIEDNGANNKNLRFLFKNIIFEYLDRCGMPIDFMTPKKWEWIEEPILIKFVADSSSGKIEFMTCVFSSDQEESKTDWGTIDHTFYDERKDDFAPKITYDD